METLRYSQNKLMLRILGAGGACAAALFLFLTPDVADMLPFPFDSFGGDIGHYIVCPFTIFLNGGLAWLAGLRLSGGRAAVECLPAELRVTTFWGRKRIAWGDLGHIYLIRKRRRFFLFARHYLVFHCVARGAFANRRVRLPIDATELPRGGYEAFRQDLLAFKRKASDAPAERAGVYASDFDPDAALARYLARKAEAAREAPPLPAPVPGRAKPVFGRRVV